MFVRAITLKETTQTNRVSVNDEESSVSALNLPAAST